MVFDLFFSDKGDKSNVFKLHEELANPYSDCLQKGVFLCLIFGTTGVDSARSRWVGACNSLTKPMSRHFLQTDLFLGYLFFSERKAIPAQWRNEVNGRFPNYLWPLFQSESWCSSCHIKISFICMWMKTYFHMKRWAPGLALKKRPKVTRKWPISFLWLLMALPHLLLSLIHIWRCRRS